LDDGVTGWKHLFAGEAEELELLREGVVQSQKPKDGLQAALCDSAACLLLRGRREQRTVSSIYAQALAEVREQRATVRVNRNRPDVASELLDRIRQNVPVPDRDPIDPADYAEAIAEREEAQAILEGDATLLAAAIAKALDQLERVDALGARNAKRLTRVLKDLSDLRKEAQSESPEVDGDSASHGREDGQPEKNDR
jgi:hypothetical protein